MPHCCHGQKKQHIPIVSPSTAGGISVYPRIEIVVMPLAISMIFPMMKKWRPVTTNQIITIDSMMTDWIYSKTNIFWHLLTHCLKETTTKLFTNDTHGSL